MLSIRRQCSQGRATALTRLIVSALAAAACALLAAADGTDEHDDASASGDFGSGHGAPHDGENDKVGARTRLHAGAGAGAGVGAVAHPWKSTDRVCRAAECA